MNDAKIKYSLITNPAKKWISTFLLFLALFISNSAASQFNLNFESARNLARKNVEIMGGYSTFFYTREGQVRDILNNSLGFKFGIGVSDIFDFKLGYIRFLGNESISSGFNTLSFYPKLSTRRQIFALAFPFGFHFRSEYEPIWYIAPKLLFTAKVKNVFEATLCPNVYIQFAHDSDFWVGLNLGLGVSSNLDIWSIRPEIGLMQTIFDRGIYWNLGLSFAYIIHLKNQKNQ